MDAIRGAAVQPPLPAVSSIRPAAATNDPEAKPRALEPAVSVEVAPQAAEPSLSEPARLPEQRSYVRDADSRDLVFRLSDPATGEVVFQIPDELVLKARAYAREAGAAPTGERLATVA